MGIFVIVYVYSQNCLKVKVLVSKMLDENPAKYNQN